MPGYGFDFELWLVGHLDVRRPDFYFKHDRPEVMRMEVTPPPPWAARPDTSESRGHVSRPF